MKTWMRRTGRFLVFNTIPGAENSSAEIMHKAVNNKTTTAAAAVFCGRLCNKFELAHDGQAPLFARGPRVTHFKPRQVALQRKDGAHFRALFEDKNEQFIKLIFLRINTVGLIYTMCGWSHNALDDCRYAETFLHVLQRKCNHPPNQCANMR